MVGLRTCVGSEREAVGQGPEEVEEEGAEEEMRGGPGRKLLRRRRPDFGQDGSRGGVASRGPE